MNGKGFQSWQSLPEGVIAALRTKKKQAPEAPVLQVSLDR